MDEGKASHRFKEINRIFSQDIKLYILYRILGNHKDHIACLHSLPWKNSFSGKFTYKYNKTVPPTYFSKILKLLKLPQCTSCAWKASLELWSLGWAREQGLQVATSTPCRQYHKSFSLRWAGGLTNLSIKSLSKASSQPLSSSTGSSRGAGGISNLSITPLSRASSQPVGSSTSSSKKTPPTRYSTFGAQLLPRCFPMFANPQLNPSVLWLSHYLK